MRIFAILNDHEEVDVGENILKHLPDGSEALVFTKNEKKTPEISGKTIKMVKIPEEFSDKRSKMRNFIIKTVRESGFSGFLHVSEDSVRLKSDPVSFFDDVERMMTTFGLKSWYNTALDGCNYVFSKYNPRFSISVDVENTPISGKTIHWCSNANTEWTVFDLNGAEDKDLMLDERFGIAMYYIIEFLARRRNQKSQGELHYMNMYPGLDSELQVLDRAEVCQKKDENEDFRKEDVIFKEMKVDNHPDMDIDVVIQEMSKKLEV